MEGNTTMARPTHGDNRTESQAKPTSNSSRSYNDSGTRTRNRQGSQNQAGMNQGSQERDQGQEDVKVSRSAATQTVRSQNQRTRERDMLNPTQTPGSAHAAYYPSRAETTPKPSDQAATNQSSPRSSSEDDEDADGDTEMTDEQVYGTPEVEPQNAPTPPPRPPRTRPTYSTAVAVSQVPPQPYPNHVTRGISSASAQAAQMAQGPPLPRTPNEYRTGPSGAGQNHRGHGSGLEVEENTVQQPQGGGGLFNMAKTVIGMGSAAPRDKAKEAYEKLQSECRQLQSDLQRCQNENYHYRGELQHLHGEVHRYREKNSALQTELNHVYEDLEASRQLSDVRGKELLGAQVFLTKADMLSVSELTQKVTDLNDETFQAAALLAESLTHQEATWSTDAEKAVSCNIARNIIGEPMLRTLTNTTEPEPNPLLVQLTVQICLTEFCRMKLETWYEGDSITNEFLTHIYGEIHKSGKTICTAYYDPV